MTDIDLSIVLVTNHDYARLRKTVRRIAEQANARKLQLILVCRRRDRLQVDSEDVRSLGRVDIVEAGEIDSTGRPRVLGAAAAEGDITVFAEDHCFPEPGWASALLEAHRQGHAAVGPAMRNANPGTALSWADMCLNFGPSVTPSLSEPTSLLCWHNTSYLTEVLREVDDLEPLLEAEGVFFRRLERAGKTLYRAADSQVTHTNLSRFDSFLRGQFWGTRLFWATLATTEAWSWGHRLLFACATPLLTVRRLLRATRDLWRSAPGRLGSAAPFLVAGSIALTLGAIAGLLVGQGNCMPHRLSIEFERERHLVAAEQGILHL